MTRTVTVGLRLNAQGFRTEARGAEADVARLDRQLTGVGRNRGFHQATGGAHTLRNALTGIVGGAAGAGLVKLVVDSTRAAASYETTLRQVAVASGVTGAKAKQVTGAMDALAIKLGKDTVFSAQDAAQAMLELAKGGLNAVQIQGGAAASTLTLATAGGLELANAAGYIVQGLTTFNLTAAHSAEVAAALAGGANASTASVEDMGLALSQVGPGAVASGLSLQETTAVLAGFANNGMKGSDAGTSLKTMLQRLVPQTKKAKEEMRALGLTFVDAHGQFLPIADIAEQLHTKLGKLSEAERTQALNQIFGSDASRAAYVLMKEGKRGVEDLTKATSDQSAAAQMSKATTDGLAGSLSQLSGSVDTAKLQLGRALAPLIRDLADHTTQWANTLTEKGIPKLELFIRGMENGTGPGGHFADMLSEIGHAAQDAWHVGSDIFEFVDRHQDLFKTVAKDAAALAVAMKAISTVKKLPVLGSLLGGSTVGGGAGGGIAGRPVPVFVTNLGGLGGVPGEGGGPAPAAGRRGATARAAATGAFSGLAGGLIGLGTSGSDATAWGSSMATAAAAGFMAGGPPGAIIATIGDAVVMGFQQGGKRAKEDKSALADFKAALSGIATAPLTPESTKAVDDAVSHASRVVQELAKQFDLTTSTGVQGALDAIDKLGGPSSATARWKGELQAISTAYRQVGMDSLQLDNYKTRLVNFGMQQAAAMNATAKGVATHASDSVDRLTARFPHLVAQAHAGTDSLHNLEREISGIPAQSSVAQTSLHALEQQIQHLPSHKAITISVQMSTGQLSLHAAETQLGIPHATGGYIAGPGTGTSDSIPARLSNGEFVINARSTARHLPLLKAINDGAPGFAAGGHVSTTYNPRGGSVSHQATNIRRQGGTIEDVQALMASWDAYLTHLDQVKQRAALVSAYVHAKSAADKAQAKKDLADFDAQTRIDNERAAVDRLTTSMQKAADVETHRREIMDNKYKLGLVSGKAEAADLDKRMAKVEKYSDEWMQLYDQKQQVLGDTRQKQLDTVTFAYPYSGKPVGGTPVGGGGSLLKGITAGSSTDQQFAQIVVQKESTAKDIVRELAWLRR